MVALLDKSPLPSKTALRARGATSSFTSRRAIALKSSNHTELDGFTYDTCRRLGSCSKEGSGFSFGYTNSPADSIDPSGLISVFLDSVPSKDNLVPCKSRVSQEWDVGLTEKPRPGLTGWIIQRVCVSCGVSDCPCNSAYTWWTSYDKHNTENGLGQCFLEAWFVDGKGNVEFPTDTFFVSARDKTCGMFSITGEMIFIDRAFINKVLKDSKLKPPLFTKGYQSKVIKCDSTFKIGPWTTEEVELWEKFKAHASFREQNAASHELWREWECCDCKKDHFSWISRTTSSGGSESGYGP